MNLDLPRYIPTERTLWLRQRTSAWARLDHAQKIVKSCQEAYNQLRCDIDAYDHAKVKVPPGIMSHYRQVYRHLIRAREDAARHARNLQRIDEALSRLSD